MTAPRQASSLTRAAAAPVDVGALTKGARIVANAGDERPSVSDIADLIGDQVPNRQRLGIATRLSALSSLLRYNSTVRSWAGSPAVRAVLEVAASAPLVERDDRLQFDAAAFIGAVRSRLHGQLVGAARAATALVGPRRSLR